MSPFVPIAISAVIAFSCVAIAWIIARQVQGARTDPPNLGNDRLKAENRELKMQMTTLLDRVAVLERIATDPAERTAREIDELRGEPLAKLIR